MRLAFLLAFAVTSCSKSDVGVSAVNVYTAEALLIGGNHCKTSDECASGYCSLNICVGYLAASTEVARSTIAKKIVEASKDTTMAARMVSLSASVLADNTGDRFVRGRAADIFRFLPPGAGLAILPSILEDPEEPIRFFASRALHVLGDSRGTRVLEAFIRHPSEAVRMLAKQAIEGT